MRSTLSLSTTILVVAVCIAQVVMPASAAAKWEVEGKAFTEGQSESISVGAEGNTVISGKLLGAPFQVQATGIVCDATCVVNQVGSVNHSSETLKLTGFSVTNPPGCGAATSIHTKALTNEMIMDPSGGTATFIKFFPESGSTIAEFEITGCVAEGIYAMKGTVTCRTNNTGVLSVALPITCSAAEQTTGGGGFQVAGNPASLVSRWFFRMTGINLGKVFGGS